MIYNIVNYNNCIQKTLTLYVTNTRVYIKREIWVTVLACMITSPNAQYRHSASVLLYGLSTVCINNSSTSVKRHRLHTMRLMIGSTIGLSSLQTGLSLSHRLRILYVTSMLHLRSPNSAQDMTSCCSRLTFTIFIYNLWSFKQRQ